MLTVGELGKSNMGVRIRHKFEIISKYCIKKKEKQKKQQPQGLLFRKENPDSERQLAVPVGQATHEAAVTAYPLCLCSALQS